MVSFADHFQSIVNYGEDTKVVSLADLRESLEHSYLAQEPVIESRLKSLVSSIIKDQQLWQLPEVAYLASDDIYVLVSGRHRYYAAHKVCTQYGLNAKGKIVSLEGGENPDVETFDDEMKVRVVTVPDKKSLVLYLQSANGSRSMTTQEKNIGKEFADMLTPLEQLKLKLAKRIESLFKINGLVVTANTCRDIAVKLAKCVGKKFAYVTPENIEQLATDFVLFAVDNWDSYESNFARDGYKQACDSFIICDAPDEVLDSDGDVIEDGTYFSWFNSTIKEKTKAKKQTKTQELAAQLAALQAQLASLGVTPAV